MGQRGDPATDGGQAGGRRGRALPTSLLLMAVLAAAVTVGAVLGRHHSVGNLLGSGVAGASTPAPLTPTRVVGLPGHTIANGTDPLGVVLSAPPAKSSPRPTLFPAVAGTWSTVGNTEIFTPASTLAPCSTYTLTVWAHTFAAGHSPVGRRHVLQLNVLCPSITGLQQALARLDYLGAKLHPIYVVHIHPRQETLREAAVHAYRPPRGRLAPDPANAPPVELGKLDESTKGGLEVFQEDHHLEPTGVPNAATWRLLLMVEGLYHRNPRPYTWVSVTESLPETLEVHEGDRVALSYPREHGGGGRGNRTGHLPDLRARYLHDDGGHGPRRGALRGTGCPLGELLQRGRRRSRLPARLLRLPAVQRLRGAAGRSRRCGVPETSDRGHRVGHVSRALLVWRA